jgi:potassium-transporting ATPase KdpC subunit
MLKQIKPAIILFALLTLITGVIYPLVVTAIAQLLFPFQANGSLILDDTNKPVASRMIGQSFSSPGYFWGRPSATSPFPYNAEASSGSNLGPTNSTLIAAITSRIEVLKAADPGNKAPIPVDLITTSASGLDPHISPDAAVYQINRVAKARNIDPQKIRNLIEANTSSRQFWLLGEPRVNVLMLNLALDAMSRAKGNS